MNNKEKEKKKSKADTVKGLMVPLWIILAIIFAYMIYDLAVLKPQRPAEIDREYEAEMDALDDRAQLLSEWTNIRRHVL